MAWGFWTKEKIEKLRSIVNDYSNTELAGMFGVGYNSIALILSRNGIKRNKVWTKEKINKLKELVDKHMDKELAKIFGVTKEAIHCAMIHNNIKRKKLTMEEHFWSKVDKKEEDECWEWVGSKDGNGYGVFTHKKLIRAHRFSYIIHKGKIPKTDSDGNRICVCHTCDNPPCVNPKHLWLGTDMDNIKDMMKKGRGKNAKGEKCSVSKLKNNNIIYIREQYKNNKKTVCRLAKEFGVSTTNIYAIVKRKTWKHI